MAKLSHKDPARTYEQISANYRKGPLRLLSSKYFLTCRVAIVCAFKGDLSREVGDHELCASFAYTARRLHEIDPDLVPERDGSENARVARLRDICISNGYLFSSMRTRDTHATWRVTPDARRAFDAADMLADEQTNDFTSARFKAIMSQLEQIEIDFTANRQRRAQMIQRQIDRLVKERDDVLSGTSVPLTKRQAIDELETLHVLMRDLPTDVESVAYHVQQQTSELTDELDHHTRTFSEILRDFNTQKFDILVTSAEGRSYTDALRIMTTDEMDEITQRLEALEKNELVHGAIVSGYLSRAWDDMLRAIDHVQENNREGSSIVVKCTQSAVRRVDKKGAAKRAAALRAIAGDARLATRLETMLPWQYPMLAIEPLLVYQDETGFTRAETTSVAPPDEHVLDHARLTILAGPYRKARAKEIVNATAGMADDDVVFVSKVLNALPAGSRRLVEWAGLFEHLTKHGATTTGPATWRLTDADGKEGTWVGEEIVIHRRDLIAASM